MLRKLSRAISPPPLEFPELPLPELLPEFEPLEEPLEPLDEPPMSPVELPEEDPADPEDPLEPEDEEPVLPVEVDELSGLVLVPELPVPVEVWLPDCPVPDCPDAVLPVWPCVSVLLGLCVVVV